MKWLLPAMAVVLFACRKETPYKECDADCIVKTGKVLNLGRVETDGCGWVIYIDSVYYHPKILDNSFKQNQLAVRVTYKITGDDFLCGRGGFPLKIIDIIDISR